MSTPEPARQAVDPHGPKSSNFLVAMLGELAPALVWLVLFIGAHRFHWPSWLPWAAAVAVLVWSRRRKDKAYAELATAWNFTLTTESKAQKILEQRIRREIGASCGEGCPNREQS